MTMDVFNFSHPLPPGLQAPLLHFVSEFIHELLITKYGFGGDGINVFLFHVRRDAESFTHEHGHDFLAIAFTVYDHETDFAFQNLLMVFIHDIDHDVMGFVHILFLMLPQVHQVVGKHVPVHCGLVE